MSNETYDKMVKEFIPEFGNENHISIKDKIIEVGKAETKLQRALNSGKDFQKIFKDVESLKRGVVFSIKNNKQTKI